jgi:hypothetical protein
MRKVRVLFVMSRHSMTQRGVAGKKWSKEKLAKRMEEAAEVMKSVYRHADLSARILPLLTFRQRITLLRYRHPGAPDGRHRWTEGKVQTYPRSTAEADASQANKGNRRSA